MDQGSYSFHQINAALFGRKRQPRNVAKSVPIVDSHDVRQIESYHREVQRRFVLCCIATVAICTLKIEMTVDERRGSPALMVFRSSGGASL